MVTLSIAEHVARQALMAKAANRTLAALSVDHKKKTLEAMADALEHASKELLFHNLHKEVANACLCNFIASTKGPTT